MTPENMPSHLKRQLAEAEASIHRILVECLPHGFFSISLTGRKTRKDRIEILVEGGPTYKHTLNTEDLFSNCDSWSRSADQDESQ